MENWQRKLLREAIVWGMGIAVGRVIIGLIMHHLEEREVSKWQVKPIESLKHGKAKGEVGESR